MLWNNLRWWDKYKREVGRAVSRNSLSGPSRQKNCSCENGPCGAGRRAGCLFSFEALDPRGSRVLLSPRADRSPPWAGPLSFFPGQSLGGSFPQGGGWDCLPWPARCRPTVQSHTANPSTVTNFPPWPTAVRSDGAMGRGGHLLTCHSIRVLWAAAMSSAKVPSDQQCRFSAAWGVCPSDVLVHRPPSTPRGCQPASPAVPQTWKR